MGRKHGIAVRRNLFKRRLREVFRLDKHGLARGWDVVLAPKGGKPQDPKDFPPGYSALAEDFQKLTAPLRKQES